MSVKNAIQDMILWRGLNFLSVFILNVLVARFFGASDSGTIFFFINNLSLLILLLGFSLESGLGFYGASGKISRSQLGLLALGWCVLATVIGFFVLSYARSYFELFPGTDSIAIASGFIIGTLLVTFFSALFFAQQKFVLPNALSLAVNLVVIVLFFAGMEDWLDDKTLLYAYFGSFLVQGAGMALAYFLSKRVTDVKRSFNHIIPAIVKYSSVVFLSNLVFFLVYRIDYWFVEIYCSDDELGNYIQVARIIQWLLMVPLMISSVLFPLTASGSGDAMRPRIILLSRVLLWIYCIISVVIAAAGRWGFIWLFGETYGYMYPVFLLHIPGLLALAALYPVSSYNAGIRRVDINLQGSLLALAVIVVLNAAFTPAYGIYAASIASSAGYLVYFVFSIYKFSRQSKLTFVEMYSPLKSDFDSLKSILYRRK